MLEISPTLGKNERGEFALWLVYYRIQNQPSIAFTSHYQLDKDTFLNYIIFPWVFRGTPDIETFDAMHALGAMRLLPHPWPSWDEYRRKFFRFFTQGQPDGSYKPVEHPWEWVLSTDVSEAAIVAAIRRKKETMNESIGPAENRSEAVQVR